MYKEPVVSITVVLYNSDACLRPCLSSVLEDVKLGRAELLVVDNNSPDDGAEIVAREFPEARLIQSKFNRGFAGGCNYSWPYVRGRYWLLLNPDAIVPEGGIAQLVEWMDAHPEIGAASPEISDSHGNPGCPGRPFPSIPRSLLELTRLHLLLPHRYREQYMQGHYSAGRDQLDVGFVPGTALIVRREAVEQAGLLSEEVLIYGEDSEWCWRIRSAGWRVGVCGQVCFQHDEGQSAVRTWGEEERTRRIWAGLYDSCRLVHGRLYARTLTAINALAFAVESIHPRRSQFHRRNSARLLRTHLALLRKKS